jgi:DNA primase
MNKRLQNAREIIAASDIVEVIGSYFPLMRDGSNYRARCPFHDEQAPTFHVDAERQTFQCFGCAAEGGVVDFVARYEGEDEDRALKKLAARAGIAVAYLSAAQKGEHRHEKDFTVVHHTADQSLQNDTDAALLITLIEKHICDWKRIEVIDGNGQKHVFEQ